MNHLQVGGWILGGRPLWVHLHTQLEEVLGYLQESLGEGIWENGDSHHIGNAGKWVHQPKATASPCQTFPVHPAWQLPWRTTAGAELDLQSPYFPRGHNCDQCRENVDLRVSLKAWKLAWPWTWGRERRVNEPWKSGWGQGARSGGGEGVPGIRH